MLFRYNREFLDEALKTVIVVRDCYELAEKLRKEYSKEYGIDLSDLELEFEFVDQGYDERINWRSYLVCVKNFEHHPGHWFFQNMPPNYFGAVGHADSGGP